MDFTIITIMLGLLFTGFFTGLFFGVNHERDVWLRRVDRATDLSAASPATSGPMPAPVSAAVKRLDAVLDSEILEEK